MIPKKLVVLGLDAADLDVMRPLIERGEMPHIARLMAEGASGVLHSTVPPVSAPAWASFLTGRGPGKHGLCSFVVERGGGRMQLANVTDIHGPKLWDVAAAQGAKPIVVNVPVTWPAPSFDGLMVTGMLTPESRGVVFTHPPSLADEIAEKVPGYRIDIDRALLDDRANAYQQMSEMERRRKDLFLHLLRSRETRLFVGIFTNTDRVQHSFWRSDRALVDRHFREVDAHVGEIVAALDLTTTGVMLLSDHGFQGSVHKVYVNKALEDAGLLATRRAEAPDEQYERRRPDTFEGFQGGRGEKAEAPRAGLLGSLRSLVGIGGETAMDWPATRAFMWSVDSGGIAVNLRSRYPHGVVADADYEKVRDEIVRVLSSLTVPGGGRAFRAVRRREEVYSGPRTSMAPDVVAEPHDSVSMGIDLGTKEAVRVHKRAEGHHSPRGFVSLTGAGFRRGTKVEGNIVDCLPTILHALGLAVPEGCDGRVIDGAFAETRPVRTMPDPAESGAAAGKTLSADEEAELRKSLEGLGYL
jgi:predicted AlkP superfamily phosphohydrolase/phosphomutase